AGGWPATVWAPELAPPSYPAHAAASNRRAVHASGRVAGSRLISAVITGPSGPADFAGGGSPCTMLASTAIALPWPSNGPRPSTAAYRVAPSHQRAAAGTARPAPPHSPGPN